MQLFLQAAIGSCPTTRELLDTAQGSSHQQFLLTTEVVEPINNFC
jgi:hypothetical protein